MKKITLLISALAFVVGGFAQNRVAKPIDYTANSNNVPTQRTCGTTDAMEQIRNQDPAAYDASLALKEQELQNWIANNYDPNAKKAIIRIPVVVQIWENTSTVPNSRVTEQIDRLNADFRRTNSDAGNTPSVFSAVDCEIEFCLATVDPNGNVTTGIIRKTVGGTPVSQGGPDLWNTTKYLNLFVYNIGGGTLGFTYLPSQLPNNAVHIGTQYFGNTGGTYGKGRTASHEVGHWLNLEHIWGDANCGDDFVADTPTQQTSNGGCPSHPSVTCNNSGDMFMNYMDYVNDNCMNAFTAGQKTRMIAAINNFRSGLLNSSGINCAAAPLIADFTESATTISAGQTITFTDASSGPNTINSWAWNFTGGTPSSFNGQSPSAITYNTPGTYTVSLTAGDGSSTDTKTKTQYITVQAAGSSVCDSTFAGWDWNTENFGYAAWTADLCTGNDGAIVGNNCYDDNGWANKVSFSGTGKELTDVLYVFVRSSGNGAANLKVWDANGTAGAPNTVLKSVPTTTGAYSANLNQFIQVPISPAIALTGDFFIGYDHAALPVDGDSLVMGLVAGTSGNQAWANETGGWIDLADYQGDYKGTVVAVICDIATGEKEILGQLNNVLVYPNPSVGTLNVALTEKTNSTVTVLNMLGEVIASQTKNTQLFTFDINNQPNGVYFIQITTGDKVTTEKVLLTK